MDVAALVLLVLVGSADTGRKGRPFELVLDAAWSEVRDGQLRVPCRVVNRTSRPAVFVAPRFFFRKRVEFSLQPVESEAERFVRPIWRYACADIHPFKREDFTEVPAGGSRPIGSLCIFIGNTPKGRYRLVGRYVFQRPKSSSQ